MSDESGGGLRYLQERRDELLSSIAELENGLDRLSTKGEAREKSTGLTAGAALYLLTALVGGGVVLFFLAVLLSFDSPGVSETPIYLAVVAVVAVMLLVLKVLWSKMDYVAPETEQAHDRQSQLKDLRVELRGVESALIKYQSKEGTDGA